MRSLILFVVLATTAFPAPYTFLYQPPAGTWQGAGVTGGIPTTYTLATTINTTGDNTDRTAFVQSALNSASTGQYVLLGPGYFRFLGSLTIPSGKELRGSGAGQLIGSDTTNETVMDFRGGGTHAIYAGSGDQYPNWPYPASGNVVSSSVAQGTTTFTISDTSLFSVGGLVRIECENQQNNTAITAGAVPVLKIGGGLTTYNRSMVTRCVSKTSSTVTVANGLLWDATGLTTRLKTSIGYGQGIGVRNAHIDLTNSTVAYGIWFESVRDSWIYNVTITLAPSYHIFTFNSTNLNIQHVWFDRGAGSGTNGAAYLSGTGYTGGYGGTCFSLIENNIFGQSVPNIEMNYGSAGNVVAYNYGIASTVPDGGDYAVANAFNTNHGPHNSYNLYEGNQAPNIECDGFFGGASEDTVFRNWWTSISPSPAGNKMRAPVLLKRFTRRYQFVGNILGTNTYNVSTYNLGYPLIGNDGFFSGTVTPTAGTFWTNWPNDTTPDSSYLERDMDVEISSTFKANYNTQDDAIPAGESIGSDTLPDSLYLSVKPTWFGNLGYPWVNSSSPSFTVAALPAAYRYINGTEPAAGGPSLVSVTVGANGTTTTVVFDQAATRGAGWNNGDMDLDAVISNNVLTYVSGDGSTSWTMTAASTINSGETVNFDFNGDANSVENGAGEDMAAVVDYPVTNNSAQGGGGGTAKSAISGKAQILGKSILK